MKTISNVRRFGLWLGSPPRNSQSQVALFRFASTSSSTCFSARVFGLRGGFHLVYPVARSWSSSSIFHTFPRAAVFQVVRGAGTREEGVRKTQEPQRRIRQREALKEMRGHPMIFRKRTLAGAILSRFRPSARRCQSCPPVWFVAR